MKRRARTLLFLLAATALLGAAVVAEVRHERVLALDPLTAIDVDAVRRLEVRCAGCTTRRFEKVDGHWLMREPRSQPADEILVAKLLAIAHAPVRFRHAARDLEAGKVGLDPPQATLVLDDTVLRFGTTDAIRSDRYVSTGESVALVPDRFSAALFMAATEKPANAAASSERR
jgi:hypothetical protein